MKALDRALAFFNFAMPLDMGPFNALKGYHSQTPPISHNSTRTKGRKFASQKSRANRRKAGMKASARR